MALDLLPEDVQRLEARIFQLEEEVRRQKATNSAMSQRITILQVDAAEFGKDFLRVSEGRLQFGKDTETVFLYLLPDVKLDPTTYTGSRTVFISSIGGETASGVFAIKTVGGSNSRESRIRMESTNTTSEILFGLEDDSNASLGLRGLDLGNTWDFEADLDWFGHGVLKLGNHTADPTTLADFDVWGRSDLNKPRVRLNGTTENLATETYVDAAGGGGMDLVVQETDQTINSQTTLQNSQLTFSIAANAVYHFEGIFYYQSVAAADIKVAMDAPSGAVGQWDFSGLRDASTASEVPQIVALSTAANQATSASKEALIFRGAVHNGANAGSITLQFAQNISDAGNTTALAGGYMLYQQES